MTEQTAAKQTVLFIDDDRFLLDMYTKKFTEEGFGVRAYTSVGDALQSLATDPNPSAIIFDLVMPQQDGFELLRQLKERKLGEHSMKIALTNQSAEEEQKNIEALGADAYIVKATMVPSEVFNMIKGLLEKGKRA